MDNIERDLCDEIDFRCGRSDAIVLSGTGVIVGLMTLAIVFHRDRKQEYKLSPGKQLMVKTFIVAGLIQRPWRLS